MKPTDIKWNGEGLPPVGGECEGKAIQGAGWSPVKVVHKTAKGVLIYEDKWGDYGGSSAPGDFRPLQSHRDRVIARAWAIMNEAHDGGLGRMANALYDAGMLVDSQPKRMSRNEAVQKLTLLEYHISGRVMSAILDALGFTEDGE